MKIRVYEESEHLWTLRSDRVQYVSVATQKKEGVNERGAYREYEYKLTSAQDLYIFSTKRFPNQQKSL